MPLTVIFAVAHLGFVAWSIPFGLERCVTPARSPMLVLISPAPMPSGEREGRKQRSRNSVSGSHLEYSSGVGCLNDKYRDSLR